MTGFDPGEVAGKDVDAPGTTNEGTGGDEDDEVVEREGSLLAPELLLFRSFEERFVFEDEDEAESESSSSSLMEGILETLDGVSSSEEQL